MTAYINTNIGMNAINTVIDKSDFKHIINTYPTRVTFDNRQIAFADGHQHNINISYFLVPKDHLQVYSYTHCLDHELTINGVTIPSIGGSIPKDSLDDLLPYISNVRLGVFTNLSDVSPEDVAKFSNHSCQNQYDV